MNHIKKHATLKHVIKAADGIVSLFILLTIFAVIAFIGFEIYQVFIHILDGAFVEILHTVALVVILVKAYRLLLYYMKSHHVAVRYVVEISIIAPAVELIFNAQGRDFAMNILFAVFGLANLLIYVFFCKKLTSFDNESVEDEQIDQEL